VVGSKWSIEGIPVIITASRGLAGIEVEGGIGSLGVIPVTFSGGVGDHGLTPGAESQRNVHNKKLTSAYPKR
jgi:hypothetical protein